MAFPLVFPRPLALPHAGRLLSCTTRWTGSSRWASVASSFSWQTSWLERSPIRTNGSVGGFSPPGFSRWSTRSAQAPPSSCSPRQLQCFLSSCARRDGRSRACSTFWESQPWSPSLSASGVCFLSSVKIPALRSTGFSRRGSLPKRRSRSRLPCAVLGAGCSTH